MSEVNRLTGAFAMLLLVHGVAPGGTPAPQPESRQPPPTERPIESESSDPLEDWSRSRIERELVRRLAAGEEVATLHAELRQRSDTPRRATIESTGSAAPDAIAGTVERLLAADLLAHYELESVGERLIAGGAHETAIRRWEEAERLYQERRERLLDPGALDDVSALLDELAPASRPILRAGLPYGTVNMPPREPVFEPTIVPVYVQVDAPPPSGADHGGVAGDPHAGLTEPILEQARVLGHDAVRLFELVQTEIATEWYAGAMKGADGTLRQRAGNDVDQASLLIALLRAGGSPRAMSTV
jgi:hypothetical protein